MSSDYSVYEAKAKLSEILRLVKADREVVITERGRRIARIIPYVADAEPDLEERLDALRQRGQIKAARVSPQELTVKWEKRPGALERFLGDRS